METIEKIKEIAAQAVPAAKIEIINSTPAAQQPALLVDREHIYAVGKFFKEDPRFQMDFCSCVTAVDYLPRADKPGCIEVVYHLYSVAQKQGPIVLKVRAPRELDQCRVPSLTPLWRACEFQEREAYDLYGVKFDGHPDLHSGFEEVQEARRRSVHQLGRSFREGEAAESTDRRAHRKNPPDVPDPQTAGPVFQTGEDGGDQEERLQPEHLPVRQHGRGGSGDRFGRDSSKVGRDRRSDSNGN